MGAVRALFERDFRPEVIVGVSVGAINGACLAANPSLDGVDALLHRWEEADTRSIFGSRIARALEMAGGMLLNDASAFQSHALRSFLERSISVRRFGETAIPLVVVASELRSGTSRLLRSGDLLEAILASTAIPGVFAPVEIDGEHLVDGAITDPLPLAALLERGVRRAVLVEAGRSCGCRDNLGHTSGLLQRAISVVLQDRMDLLLEAAPSDMELVTLGSVCHPENSITDLSDATMRARLGYRDAVDRLDG